jgi:GNAT superfamily N-acetyltransferase
LARRSSWLRSAGARGRENGSVLPEAGIGTADATVAIVDAAVVGFVMVVDDEVEQVYVAAGHRGTGVAHGLMGEAERRVLESGHRKAWLAVVAGNGRARAFYERAGWVDEGPFDYAAVAGGATIAVPCRRYTKLL